MARCFILGVSLDEYCDRGESAKLCRIAKVNGWPGYFGAPRLASAAMGAQAFSLSIAKAERSGTEDSDGLEHRKYPRYADPWILLMLPGKEQNCNMSKCKRNGNWIG